MTAVEHRSQGSPRAQGARLKRHRALKGRTRELRFGDSRHRIRWSRGLTSEDHASDLRFRACKPENVPGFRKIRSKPLRARRSDLGVSNSRMSHEGGGCAVCCANCAGRSRCWRLEASRTLLGGIRREIRVDRARRLRVTGGGPRSFPVWVSQPVMRLRPEGPGASLFAGAGAGRTIGSCQHRCGCDTRAALLSAHGSDM